VTFVPHPPRSAVPVRGVAKSELLPAMPSVGDVLAQRYRLVARLGRGGMGVVFAAEDLQSGGERLAVKVLTRSHAPDLAQLKNEFRALSDVRHPNLVRLHQLASWKGSWFLVMDLVEGPHFLDFVRHGAAGLDEERLRWVLAELLAAVSALHAAGKIHRDLKPSNVLVAVGEGRGSVRVIDFGLTRDELEDSPSHDPLLFVGTPAYAAPEQVLSEPCSPAADLYAIGVMLYEALTGQVPFTGDNVSQLLHKVGSDPRPPSQLAPVARDLEQLTMRLLARDPTQRPTAHDVLVELGAAGVERVSTSAQLLIGRDGELDLLETALGRAQKAPVLMFVHGPSGIGKSSLLKRFGEIARDLHGALLFSGRCYAREQVPFKAFDALVEQVARHVARLPPRERVAVLPADLPVLARVFPAFERFLERNQRTHTTARDLVQLRDRAFLALKHVLSGLSLSSPVIVCLDDLQWGDVDSAALLRELLMPPGAPRCLFLCSFRSEERDTSAMLQSLARAALPVSAEELALAPLSREHAEQLLFALVPDGASPEGIDEAVHESRGSPFLLQELARLMREGRSSVVPELVAHGSRGLTPSSRRLLEVVAVAGRPVPLPVALSASGSGVNALLELIASHRVRLRMVDDHECIEPYHDRLREAITRTLPDEDVRALLSVLGRCHAQAHPEQVDVLVELYQRAGELDRAAHYAVRAAEQSASLLAFDRAADLYAFALAYAAEGDRASLEIACAAACANAGRVREAGARYERAAGLTRGAEARRAVQRKAVLYHLTAGDLEPGERILGELCREIGLRSPPQRMWKAVVMAWWLYFVYVLGTRIRRLPMPEPTTRDAPRTMGDERVELAFTAARGLGHHAFAQASCFVMEGLLLTRRQRNPRMWAPALVSEAYLENIGKAIATPASDRAVEQALAHCEAVGDVSQHAFVLASAGARDLYVGRIAAAERAFERAEAVLRERGLPVQAVCNFTRSGRLAVWHATGAMDRVLGHAERWLLEARAMGDPFGELVVNVMGSQRFLALDQVERARESLRALDEPLGKRSQFLADPWWRADIELYEDEPLAALEICRAARKLPLQLAVESTSLHRSWLAFTEARSALGALKVERREKLWRLAQRRLKRLRQQKFAPARFMALQVEASLAELDGRRDRAIEAFGEAATGFAALGMELYAAACRFRQGRLAGEIGRVLCEEARGACVVRGIHDPERWLRMLAPG
jgi:hypothetical protein